MKKIIFLLLVFASSCHHQNKPEVMLGQVLPFGFMLGDNPYNHLKNTNQEIINTSASWVRFNVHYNQAVNNNRDFFLRWEERLSDLKNSGMNIMACVYAKGKQVKNYFPHEPDELSIFENNVAKIIKTFGPMIDVWQLENELCRPDRWKQAPEGLDRGQAYAHLFSLFSKIVDQHDPTAKITSFGITGPNKWNQFKEVFLPKLVNVCPKGFDYFDVHAHASHKSGVNYIKGFTHIKEEVSQLFNGVQIISSEGSTWAGDALNLNKQSEDEQAAHFIRKQLCLMSTGTLFCIYGPVSDRPHWKGEVKPHRFNRNGFFKINPTQPKTIVTVMKRLAVLWHRGQWQRFEYIHEDGIEKIYCYNQEDHPVGLFLWSRRNKGHQWNVPKKFSGHKAVNPVSDQYRLSILKENQRILLSRQPLFITEGNL